MKPACTCSTFHFNTSTLFFLKGNLPLFCCLLIFFKISFFLLLLLLLLLFLFFLVISGECQAVWIQIMPVGSDLGLNCLQRLSADDTSK